MSERETTRPLTPAAPAGTDATAYAPPAAPDSTAPAYSNRPVAFRRADTVAALFLLLAGAAAGIALPLRWLTGSDLTGLDLVRAGFDDLGAVLSSGLWQPLAIVLGGGVLFVLGLLLFVPSRTHRSLGFIELIVSIVIATAVLVPLADAGWDLDVFDLGFWFAMAVPVLGLLGSLKALATRPKYATRAPAS
jgi:hypothetical protein